MSGFVLKKSVFRPVDFEEDEVEKEELVLPGMPVSYYVEDKNICVRQAGLENYKLGIVLDTCDGLAHVIYKSFLNQTPYHINIYKDKRFAQYDIKTQFENQRKCIIDNMPSVKKLKRLNLKLLDPKTIGAFTSNFDKVMKGYSDFFGTEECEMFKEKLMTTDIFVFDNRHYLLYRMHDDTYHIPSDGYDTGYFLCYFSFKI